MNKKKVFIFSGIGCGVIVLALLAGAAVFFLWSGRLRMGTMVESRTAQATPTWTAAPGARATQQAVPTLTSAPESEPLAAGDAGSSLAPLYHEVNPGVVNIRVYVRREGVPGSGAGSGFILDEQGHIVTNHHVVAGADQVTVVFYNEMEAEAEIVGVDADSDLAVIRVDQLPEEVHPLALGDSDQVQVGEWVVAIGNPFGLGSSMTIGIVSAVGRTIPSQATSFGIPQAIQTDAAINPGNSGGPLIDVRGEVIGVNAQIASGGTQANAGVGFAIPAEIVRRVVPVLIENGTYQWPWLGVRGNSVNLAIVQANDLDRQQGAYIHAVVEEGPAAEAGLQGSTGTTQVEGFDVPVGGDIVIAIDGVSVAGFSDLLTEISHRQPGDTVTLTVLRDGQEIDLAVELEARPDEVGP